MDVYWEQFKTPFLCFAGFSGVGKTTLLEHLIKRFTAEEIRVGYYKHDSHRFEVDRAGQGHGSGHPGRRGALSLLMIPGTLP